jgi:hypothetical protein
MSTLHCWGRGLQKYLLYIQMSIQCVEYAFTVIYLLLVARNFRTIHLMFYVTWSPEHKIFLFFTELNNEDTYFWMASLQRSQPTLNKQRLNK